MPAFTENLRGVSPEESREFDVTYPADYDRATLAGRTVRFKATVKAVRRKELPEANDDFAKDLGDYQTLDEVKEAIRKSILAERENHAREETKHQIIEKLVDEHPFPVPDSYVDRQIEIGLENQLRQLSAQGIDPRSLKLDWQKIREAQKDRATRDVRASLILDKIADRESIIATQDEVDREVQRIARQQREAVALVRPKLQKDGTLNRIAGQIRTEKTLAMLFDKARKEAPQPRSGGARAGIHGRSTCDLERRFSSRLAINKHRRKLNRAPQLPSWYTKVCRRFRALHIGHSGRGSAWLERLVRDQEAGGSNPLAPTKFPLIFNYLQVVISGSFFGRSLFSHCAQNCARRADISTNTAHAVAPHSLAG